MAFIMMFIGILLRFSNCKNSSGSGCSNGMYHDFLSGQDSTLRNFSTIHDRLNKSLGRASYNKAETKRSGLKADKHMMPFITDFASSK